MILVPLEEADVLAIFDRIQAGDKNVDIARDFAVSEQTISGIKTGQIWSRITGVRYEPRKRAPRNVLSDEQVLEVDAGLRRGDTVKELASRFGVTRSVIYNIAIGKTRGQLTGRG